MLANIIFYIDEYKCYLNISSYAFKISPGNVPVKQVRNASITSFFHGVFIKKSKCKSLQVTGLII